MNVQLLDKMAPTLGAWYAPIETDLDQATHIFDDELVSHLPLVNEF